MNISEAIASNYISFPVYVNCAYSLIDEVNQRELMINMLKDGKKKRYLLELLEQLKQIVNQSLDYKSIIEKYITKKNGKYLIICDDENKFINLFNDFTEINFKSDISDNLLREENYDGIIILKKIDCKIDQLIGVPLIIDLANNLEIKESLFAIRDEVLNYLGFNSLDEMSPELRKKFEIYDNTKNVIGLLEKIDFIYVPILPLSKVALIIQEYMEVTGKSYDEIKQKDKYKGVNIGTIISSRKRKYKLGTLSKKDEIILRNLGETFEDKRIVKTFEEMLAIISEYLVNTGKKYKDIKYDDVYKKINIGKWKYSRRNEYKLGKLDKEKEIALRNIGEDFEINEIIPFDQMIEIIKEYMMISNKTYSQIKHLDVYKGINVGMWKNTKRMEYKKGKLSKEKEMILRSIGETFEEKRHDISFEKMIELIKEYLLFFGKKYSDIQSRDTYKGINIGHWIKDKRIKYNQGKLAKEEEMMLRNIGENFQSKRNNISFNDVVNLIKEYMKLTGITYIEIQQKTVYKGVNIGWWKNNRRKDYKNGKLSKEHELILRSLGETFPNVHRIPEVSTILVKDANLTIPSKKR